MRWQVAKTVFIMGCAAIIIKTITSRNVVVFKTRKMLWKWLGVRIANIGIHHLTMIYTIANYSVVCVALLQKKISAVTEKGCVIMKTRDNDKANKLVSKLCHQGEKVIESEYFNATNYLVKDDHIVILAGINGELAINMNSLPELIKELSEIHSVWSDID